jgi:hypothetical protein
MTWDVLLERIRSQQTEVMRVAPYRDVGLIPNPGASELALSAAEKRLGQPLPASYRAFLRRHDGWPRFFEGATLLGTASLGKPRYAELASAVFEAAETPVAEADVASRRRARSLIPFGMDLQGTTLFTFDPATRRGDGEMDVIAWINEIGLRRESFPGFLELVGELVEAELIHLAADNQLARTA